MKNLFNQSGPTIIQLFHTRDYISFGIVLKITKKKIENRTPHLAYRNDQKNATFPLINSLIQTINQFY